MTRPDHDRSPDHRTIDQAAARWLVRRETGWSPAEAREFAHWEQADPRHRAAVRRLQATQQLLAGLATAPGLEDLREETETVSQPRRARLFPAWAQVAVATAALFAVGFFIWQGFVRTNQFAGTYETETGSPQQLFLPDGSQVRLKEATVLEVHYSRGERLLHLPRGEAHFEVTRDPDRPFLVTTGALSIRAVGTAFTVRHLVPAGVEVVVTEGQVQVERPDAAPGSVASRLLAAGERLRWDSAHDRAFEPEQKPESLVLGEANDPPAIPRLVFSNTPLADAVAQFNRHSRVQLELGDSALGSRAVGGTFRADGAEAFAALLAAGGEIRVERISPERLVLHPAR